MAVGMHLDAPGMTADMYDQVMANLDWDNTPLPPGFIAHYAGPKDGGWFVFDVWESQEAFESFLHDRLGAAIGAVTGGDPGYKPEFIPIHREAHAS